MPMTLARPRRWRVWVPAGTDVEPEFDGAMVSAEGPDAWVKGGHLFVGDIKTQQWSKAWAPGGWLSCELMPSDDLRQAP